MLENYNYPFFAYISCRREHSYKNAFKSILCNARINCIFALIHQRDDKLINKLAREQNKVLKSRIFFKKIGYLQFIEYKLINLHKNI